MQIPTCKLLSFSFVKTWNYVIISSVGRSQISDAQADVNKVSETAIGFLISIVDNFCPVHQMCYQTI